MLQSMGSHRVRHDRAMDWLHLYHLLIPSFTFFQIGRDIEIIRDTSFLTSFGDMICQIAYHKGSNKKIHVKSLAQSLAHSDPFFFLYLKRNG